MMKKAVFATNEKWISVVFIPQWSDNDFEFGFIYGVPYIMEQYHGAFDKLKVKGFIYCLDPKHFKSDERLGMKNHEFISKDKVKILKVLEITNVYNYLKRQKKLKFIDMQTRHTIIGKYLKSL
jgi:hypothetical protein